MGNTATPDRIAPCAINSIPIESLCLVASGIQVQSKILHPIICAGFWNGSIRRVWLNRMGNV